MNVFATFKNWVAVLTFICISFPFFAARADTTNALSDAEIHGRALAQKILAMKPAENYTNSGILQIRGGNDKRTDVQVKFEAFATPTNWSSFYVANSGGADEDLTIVHADGEPNQYLFHVPSGKIVSLSGNQTMTPFAESDFWICDLGLEFLHWPGQKILPKTTNLKRGRDYTLLESTNPSPATNGYARVRSWIDNESGGILEAEAFDATGNQLKDFYPKSFEKVSGQYQVESMVMENIKTGSKSVLEFDLDK